MEIEEIVVARLNEALEQANISLRELSRVTRIPNSALQRYFSGETKKLPMDRLMKIAQALGAETAYIMGWEQKKLDIGTPYNPTKRIPVLGRISAGSPLYCEENIVGYTYTDLNGSENEYFALRVSGNSMNASRICDGDLVIVRRQSSVENGQIAVVMVGDDEATIKRFYNGDDHITLMPQSTDQKFLPQIYNPSQTKVTVLGLVVKIEIRV